MRAWSDNLPSGHMREESSSHVAELVLEIVQTDRRCVRILRTFGSEGEESSIVARVIKRDE